MQYFTVFFEALHIFYIQMESQRNHLSLMAPPMAACVRCKESHCKVPHCGTNEGLNYYYY